ncbi:VOC family protein [Arthrobacter sp. EpRS71]|uniref:VOC family protein n=1 Tax=Arthrobacter sp. EpRS71 TaxID=1743141 RepID=UPI000746B4D9|nr:VOC family protein [Arthrobacter sp. EpRS71]KUM34872.1 glyoxalase [Arthrobacter sp. EpRS71]
MAIAKYPSVVIDCPDAAALAAFYGELFGWEVEDKDGWFDIRPADGSNCISFQQVEVYQAPKWPGQTIPQQMHLDMIVEDLDKGEEVALSLGASKADHQPGETFRVLLDPAGHPFCLCLT